MDYILFVTYCYPDHLEDHLPKIDMLNIKTYGLF